MDEEGEMIVFGPWLFTGTVTNTDMLSEAELRAQEVIHRIRLYAPPDQQKQLIDKVLLELNAYRKKMSGSEEKQKGCGAKEGRGNDQTHRTSFNLPSGI